ncbi:hypothetical protein LEN26_011734 [Aphanomyces euteiches]|nr:hypothetical protein LEN26_011734 [Aphanomyces euteiches]
MTETTPLLPTQRPRRAVHTSRSVFLVVLSVVALFGFVLVHRFDVSKVLRASTVNGGRDDILVNDSNNVDEDDDDEDDDIPLGVLDKVENCVPFAISSTFNGTIGTVTWSTERMYTEGKDEEWIECGRGVGGLQLREVGSSVYVPFESRSSRNKTSNVTIHSVVLTALNESSAYDFIVGSSHHGYSNLHRLGRNLEYESTEAFRCRPVRLRTAYGATPDAYSFQWATEEGCTADDARVVIEEGTSAAFTSPMIVRAKRFTFDSRLEHVAFASGLKANTRYSYYVESTAYSSSIVHSFHTPPGAGDLSAPLRLLVTGDIGYQNAATLPMMQAQVARGEVDGVISVGDYAYDLHSSHGRVGDIFLTEMEPIAASVPFMVAMGNHEVKRKFSHYTNRFQLMPAHDTLANGLRNNWFYSYNVGLVHFVVLCTEIYFKSSEPGLIERQHAWLAEDLRAANANRTAAPWIIVIGHRPLYCTSDDQCDEPAAVLRDAFEDLFYDMGVDLYLCGHQHNYERMYDVYRNATSRKTVDMGATTYILTGAAGQSKVLPIHKPFERPRAPYTSFRNTIFGFSRLVVHNASHLHWQQIECDPFNPAAYNDNGHAVDDVWLVQTHHGSFNLS